MFKNVAADTNVIFYLMIADGCHRGTGQAREPGYPPPSGKGVRQYVKEHTQTDEARAGKI